MTRRRTHPPPTPLPRATTPCPAAACAQDSTSRSSCEPDPASSPELHLLPRLPSANRTPPSGFSGTAVSSGPTSSPEAVHRCSASFRPCNGLPCTALAEAGILEEYFQPGRALSTVQEDNNDSQYDGCESYFDISLYSASLCVVLCVFKCLMKIDVPGSSCITEEFMYCLVSKPVQLCKPHKFKRIHISTNSRGHVLPSRVQTSVYQEVHVLQFRVLVLLSIKYNYWYRNCSIFVRKLPAKEKPFLHPFRAHTTCTVLSPTPWR
ncbi:uncharacterized protein [Triticum aestivum]|uniref:uncharacterized protein isoform X1 n=1 Tax=Triticum aestivum TaxID=4565 RepID=UPI001D005EE7|nr:uncharacterized protein LOC123092426 isoform X1 [Triticum aestivum]XP_044370134.1 uncharacterized protein LOC123092426 isoform X1 [Triticum aestivum]